MELFADPLVVGDLLALQAQVALIVTDSATTQRFTGHPCGRAAGAAGREVLPPAEVVAEGRRVMANIERAASLFLVKNTYSLVLAIIAAGTLTAYPFAPIQLTLISTLTIGVPGLVLALGPNRRRYIPGFLHRVLRFAIPVGVLAGAAAYAGYRAVRALDPAAGVSGGRTTAALVVLAVALWTLLVLARPLAGWKLALVAAMASLAVLIVAVPALGTGVFPAHPGAPAGARRGRDWNRRGGTGRGLLPGRRAGSAGQP